MFQLQPCQHEVKSFCPVWSRENAVGVVTGIRAGMPEEAREYSENRPDPLWGPPILLFSGYVGCVPGVKQLGHEVDHLRTSRLRMSGAIPLLPLYAFMALTGTTSPSTFFPSTAAPHPHQRYYNSVCRLKFQYSVQILNALPRCAPIHGSSMRADGRTDRAKRIVTFRSFTNAFKNSIFLARNVLVCFVWISEQTAIISLYSISWFVFITETECVYWAVRTEYT
jgi:hypothetical protein